VQLPPLTLRLQLPPLGFQRDEEPIVYAHFVIPDSPCHWYVAKGSSVADDFVFFGTEDDPERSGRQEVMELREAALTRRERHLPDFFGLRH